MRYINCPACDQHMDKISKGEYECPNCGARMRTKSSPLWSAFSAISDLLDDDEDTGERLSVSDAAAIWASHGKDEDYTFGYSEDELEDAL